MIWETSRILLRMWSERYFSDESFQIFLKSFPYTILEGPLLNWAIVLLKISTPPHPWNHMCWVEYTFVPIRHSKRLFTTALSVVLMFSMVFVIRLTSMYPRCKSDDVKHGEYQDFSRERGTWIYRLCWRWGCQLFKSSKQFLVNTDFHSVPNGLVYGSQTQQPCCTQLRGQWPPFVCLCMGASCMED